jgi:cell division septum initiation protein DivIVA
MDTPHADAAMWSALPDAFPAPTFKTAKRGFEQKQVLEHVDRLNDRLRSVEHQVRQLRYEMEQAKRERDAALRERAALLQERGAGVTAAMSQPSRDGDTYEHVSDRVTELLTTLDKDIQTIRGEAEAEAQQIVDRARSEAYRVRTDSDEALATATLAAQRTREEAERCVAESESRRNDVLRELRRQCSVFLDVLGNLAASIEGRDDAGQGDGSGSDATVPEGTGPTVVLPDAAPDRA